MLIDILKQILGLNSLQARQKELVGVWKKEENKTKNDA